MSAANHKTKILFLCTGNSCRSQMAEGWARYLKEEAIEAWSAGLVSHGLNPHAVWVMAEAGVDISAQSSKTIEELPNVAFDWIITLCDHARETCPYMPGRLIHHGFPDPPTLAAGIDGEEARLDCYRMVRDRIRDFILTLPGGLFE